MLRLRRHPARPVHRLIVGLGNPGPRYEGTRHNAGFAVVQRLAADLGAPRPRGLDGALVSEAEDGGRVLALAQPVTYMNRSGQAVRALLARYDLPLDCLLVVYDEVQLPLGSLRIRPRGSAGGHNGMRSIIAALGSDDFARLRIGIGPFDPRGDGDLAEFVLAPFQPAERPLIEAAIEAGAQAARLWAAEGVERAMERFNGWRADASVPPPHRP